MVGERALLCFNPLLTSNYSEALVLTLHWFVLCDSFSHYIALSSISNSRRLSQTNFLLRLFLCIWIPCTIYCRIPISFPSSSSQQKLGQLCFFLIENRSVLRLVLLSPFLSFWEGWCFQTPLHSGLSVWYHFNSCTTSYSIIKNWYYFPILRYHSTFPYFPNQFVKPVHSYWLPALQPSPFLWQLHLNL